MAGTSPAMTKKLQSLFRRPREQQQVTVWILQYKISRAPGLAPEHSKERHASVLKLEKLRFDRPGRVASRTNRSNSPGKSSFRFTLPLPCSAAKVRRQSIR